MTAWPTKKQAEDETDELIVAHWYWTLPVPKTDEQRSIIVAVYNRAEDFGGGGKLRGILARNQRGG